ncbi:UNVERIFIED_CONTAM: methionyl-tRNA synthetase [Acetivibrio alkalicellulosi]
MNILIGGAWPYANGSLHVGHLAALLPGDVLARYHRQKGDIVSYVSGSDCHGTPVTIRAKKENLTPQEVSDKYHEEFVVCFNKLGFTYDCYGKTSSHQHKAFVKEFHKRMYQRDYIYEREEDQAYCNECAQFLPDRFVVGNCPYCKAKARGDQCEECGSVLEPEVLLESKCSICNSTPVIKKSTHLFLAITKLKNELEEFVQSHGEWRKNAQEMSKRYIKEGLRDRAITRDLDWGIDVPFERYENKKIYIWAENVLGYLSSSFIHAQEQGLDFPEIWGEDAKHYYVHGKDNIPFHTIILPSLLIANGENYRLPDEIVSSEYLTLEGRKISTSENWAIWVKEIVERYNPDSIRYFLIANGPEKRDTDFSWREFVNSNNGELLGAYGNLVNRTLVFAQKSFESKIPNGILNKGIEDNVNNLYQQVGLLIEKGEFKFAIENIFEFIRSINKYFDEEKPWITVKDNIEHCKNTIYNCINVIANVAVLLNPFLPFSSAKVLEWLKCENTWKYKQVKANGSIGTASILFERLDKKLIDEELKKLNK